MLKFMVRGRRWLAVIVLACVFPDFAYAGAPGVTILRARGIEERVEPAISLPPELGRVKDTFYPDGKHRFPVIIHVQTAHASHETALQVEKILRHLTGEHPVDLIFVEGAQGRLHPELMGFFPDQAENKKFIELLARKGEISGTDLYLLNAKPEAVGIETGVFYRAAFQNFGKVITNIHKNILALDSEIRNLDRKTSKTFSKPFRDLLEVWKKYQADRRDLGTVIAILRQEAKKALDLDFEDPVSQFEWPQLTRFAVLQELERRGDFPKYQEEAQRLKSWLAAQKIPPDFSESLDGRELTRAGYENFLRQAYPRGYRFKDYPQLTYQAAYQVLQSELEADSLMAEFDRLFEKLFQAKASGKGELEGLRRYREFALARKLLRLELSRDEWEKIKATGFLRDLQKTIPDIRAAQRFYRLSEIREKAFYRNLKREMGLRKKQMAVLVTGGFHSRGVESIFRQNGIGYVGIVPRVAGAGDTSLYHQIMLGRAHLEKPEFLQRAGQGTLTDMAYVRSELQTVRSALEQFGASLNPRKVPAYFRDRGAFLGPGRRASSVPASSRSRSELRETGETESAGLDATLSAFENYHEFQRILSTLASGREQEEAQADVFKQRERKDYLRMKYTLRALGEFASQVHNKRLIVKKIMREFEKAPEFLEPRLLYDLAESLARVAAQADQTTQDEIFDTLYYQVLPKVLNDTEAFRQDRNLVAIANAFAVIGGAREFAQKEKIRQQVSAVIVEWLDEKIHDAELELGPDADIPDLLRREQAAVHPKMRGTLNVLRDRLMAKAGVLDAVGKLYGQTRLSDLEKAEKVLRDELLPSVMNSRWDEDSMTLAVAGIADSFLRLHRHATFAFQERAWEFVRFRILEKVSPEIRDANLKSRMQAQVYEAAAVLFGGAPSAYKTRAFERIRSDIIPGALQIRNERSRSIALPRIATALAVMARREPEAFAKQVGTYLERELLPAVQLPQQSGYIADEMGRSEAVAKIYRAVNVVDAEFDAEGTVRAWSHDFFESNERPALKDSSLSRHIGGMAQTLAGIYQHRPARERVRIHSVIEKEIIPKALALKEPVAVTRAAARIAVAFPMLYDHGTPEEKKSAVDFIKQFLLAPVLARAKGEGQYLALILEIYKAINELNPGRDLREPAWPLQIEEISPDRVIAMVQPLESEKRRRLFVSLGDHFSKELVYQYLLHPDLTTEDKMCLLYGHLVFGRVFPPFEGPVEIYRAMEPQEIASLAGRIFNSQVTAADIYGLASHLGVRMGLKGWYDVALNLDFISNDPLAHLIFIRNVVVTLRLKSHRGEPFLKSIDIENIPKLVTKSLEKIAGDPNVAGLAYPDLRLLVKSIPLDSALITAVRNIINNWYQNAYVKAGYVAAALAAGKTKLEDLELDRFMRQIRVQLHDSPSPYHLKIVRAYVQYLESGAEPDRQALNETLKPFNVQVDAGYPGRLGDDRGQALKDARQMRNLFEELYGEAQARGLLRVVQDGQWKEFMDKDTYGESIRFLNAISERQLDPERNVSKRIVDGYETLVIGNFGDTEYRIELLARLAGIQARLTAGMENDPADGAKRLYLARVQNMLEPFVFSLLNSFRDTWAALDISQQRKVLVLGLDLQMASMARNGRRAELEAVRNMIERGGNGWQYGDDALRDYSILNHVERVLTDLADETAAAYQKRAEDYARLIGFEDESVRNFSANIVRESVLFAANLMAGRAADVLAAKNGFSRWHITRAGIMKGRLVWVEDPSSIPEMKLTKEDILLTHHVPDIALPEVAGIITETEEGPLSHPAIMAGYYRIPWASPPAEEYKRLKERAMKERPLVRVKVSQQSGVHIRSIKETPDAGAVPEAAARSDIRQVFLTHDQYTPGRSGTKAHNLHLMMTELPDFIPPHISMPFACFKDLIEKDRDLTRLRDVLSRYDTPQLIKDNRALVVQTLEEMQRRIENLRIPETEQRALVEGIRRTIGADKKVILRSTTSVEDLAKYPAAGVYESRINEDARTLIKDVLWVFAQFYSEKAFTERRRQGFNEKESFPGILIQELVEADYSFVIHTRNPNSADPDELLIEIAVGMGPALMSGKEAYKGFSHQFSYNFRTGKLTRLSYANKWNQATLGGDRHVDYSRDEFLDSPIPAFLNWAELFEVARRIKTSPNIGRGIDQDIEGAIVKTGEKQSRVLIVQTRNQTEIPEVSSGEAEGEDAEDKLKAMVPAAAQRPVNDLAAHPPVFYSNPNDIRLYELPREIFGLDPSAILGPAAADARPVSREKPAANLAELWLEAFRTATDEHGRPILGAGKVIMTPYGSLSYMIRDGKLDWAGIKDMDLIFYLTDAATREDAFVFKKRFLQKIKERFVELAKLKGLKIQSLRDGNLVLKAAIDGKPVNYEMPDDNLKILHLGEIAQGRISRYHSEAFLYWYHYFGDPDAMIKLDHLFQVQRDLTPAQIAANAEAQYHLAHARGEADDPVRKLKEMIRMSWILGDEGLRREAFRKLDVAAKDRDKVWEGEVEKLWNGLPQPRRSDLRGRIAEQADKKFTVSEALVREMQAFLSPRQIVPDHSVYYAWAYQKNDRVEELLTYSLLKAYLNGAKFYFINASFSKYREKVKKRLAELFSKADPSRSQEAWAAYTDAMIANTLVNMSHQYQSPEFLQWLERYPKLRDQEARDQDVQIMDMVMAYLNEGSRLQANDVIAIHHIDMGSAFSILPLLVSRGAYHPDVMALIQRAADVYEKPGADMDHARSRIEKGGGRYSAQLLAYSFEKLIRDIGGKNMTEEQAIAHMMGNGTVQGSVLGRLTAIAGELQQGRTKEAELLAKGRMTLRQREFEALNRARQRGRLGEFYAVSQSGTVAAMRDGTGAQIQDIGLKYAFAPEGTKVLVQYSESKNQDGERIGWRYYNIGRNPGDRSVNLAGLVEALNSLNRQVHGWTKPVKELERTQKWTGKAHEAVVIFGPVGKTKDDVALIPPDIMLGLIDLYLREFQTQPFDLAKFQGHPEYQRITSPLFPIFENRSFSRGDYADLNPLVEQFREKVLTADWQTTTDLVRQRVNPRGRDLRALYFGSAADVHTALLTTNAKELHLVFKDRLALRDNTHDIGTLSGYVEEKGRLVRNESAGRYTRSVRMPEDLLGPLLLELFALGVENFHMQLSGDRTRFEVRFLWKHPADEKATERVVFLYPSTDVKDLERYLDPISGEVDVVIQKGWGNKRLFWPVDFRSAFEEKFKPSESMVVTDYIEPWMVGADGPRYENVTPASLTGRKFGRSQAAILRFTKAPASGRIDLNPMALALHVDLSPKVIAHIKAQAQANPAFVAQLLDGVKANGKLMDDREFAHYALVLGILAPFMDGPAVQRVLAELGEKAKREGRAPEDHFFFADEPYLPYAVTAEIVRAHIQKRPISAAPVEADHRRMVEILGARSEMREAPAILFMDDMRAGDVALTGGKGASLNHLSVIPGIAVPREFAVTTAAYRHFISVNGIEALIGQLDDLSEKWIALEQTRRQGTWNGAGEAAKQDIEKQIRTLAAGIRESFERGNIPEAAEIVSAYQRLGKMAGKENVAVAVRSSATAEDRADASFAGQQDTFHDQTGSEAVLHSVRKVFGSLFTDRAIQYRNELSLKDRLRHRDVSISAIVQIQIQAASAGVAFDVNPATGAPDIYVSAVHGPGERLVGGEVSADAWLLDRNTLEIKKRFLLGREILDGEDVPETAFALSISEVKEVARQVLVISAYYRQHFGTTYIDTEYVRGHDGKIYFVQARPETVWSKGEKIEGFKIADGETASARLIYQGGICAFPGAVHGRIRLIRKAEDVNRLEYGDIFVGYKTLPQHAVVLDRPEAIVVSEGSITSHAAIVAREKHKPTLIAAPDVVKALEAYDGQEVTVDATNGRIYLGKLKLVPTEFSGLPVVEPSVLEPQPASPADSRQDMIERARSRGRLLELVDGPYIQRPTYELLPLQLDLLEQSVKFGGRQVGITLRTARRGNHLYVSIDDMLAVERAFAQMDLERLEAFVRRMEENASAYDQASARLSVDRLNEFMPQFLEMNAWVQLGNSLDAILEKMWKDELRKMPAAARRHFQVKASSERSEFLKLEKDKQAILEKARRIKNLFAGTPEEIEQKLSREQAELYRAIVGFASHYRFEFPTWRSGPPVLLVIDNLQKDLARETPPGVPAPLPAVPLSLDGLGIPQADQARILRIWNLFSLRTISNDNQPHVLTRGQWRFLDVLRQAGARLVAAGTLQTPGQIFSTPLPQLARNLALDSKMWAEQDSAVSDSVLDRSLNPVVLTFHAIRGRLAKLGRDLTEEPRYLGAIDINDLPYPGGVNVLAFVPGLDGFEQAGIAASQGRVNGVNFLYTLPFFNVTESQEHPGMSFLSGAAFFDSTGRLVYGYFKSPVRIDAVVHAGLRRTSQAHAYFESRGIPMLNSIWLRNFGRDKEDFKKFLRAAGIRTAPWVKLNRPATDTELRERLDSFVRESQSQEVVPKPVDGRGGEGIRMFPASQREEALAYIRGLLGRYGDILIEKRNIPPMWRDDQGRRLDWNLRVLAVWQGDHAVVTPEMITVRVKVYDENPVAAALGAEAISLEEFFRRRGFDAAQREAFLAKIIPFIQNATEQLRAFMQKSQPHLTPSTVSPGISGWDVMQEEDGEFTMMEGNFGAVGGILPLPESANPESDKTHPVILVANHLKNLGGRYRAQHGSAVAAGRSELRMQMPPDAILLVNLKLRLLRQTNRQDTDSTLRQLIEAMELDEKDPGVWEALAADLAGKGLAKEAQLARQKALSVALDPAVDVPALTFHSMKTLLGKWGHELGQEPLDLGTIDRDVLPYPDGVNVGIFIPSIDGIERAGLIASQNSSRRETGIVSGETVPSSARGSSRRETGIVSGETVPSSAREKIQGVNFLYILPFHEVHAGAQNPQAVYFGAAAFFDSAGRLVYGRFKNPVRIHAQVHAGMRRKQESRDFFESRGIPLLNSSEVIRFARNKKNFKAFLRANNLPTPDFDVVLNPQMTAEEAARKVGELIKNHQLSQVAIKPTAASRGQGVRMIPVDQRNEILAHIQLLLAQGTEVLVEGRIDSEEWVLDGVLQDWNLRVLSFSLNGDVLVDPDRIMVRYKKYDGEPVSRSQGSKFATLTQFFEMKKVPPDAQQRMIAEVTALVKDGARKMEAQLKKMYPGLPAWRTRPGILGWDVIRSRDGRWYFFEANGGSVGGIGPLEKLNQGTGKSGRIILPMASYLKELALEYKKDNPDQVSTVLKGEAMQPPEDARLLVNLGLIAHRLGPDQSLQGFLHRYIELMELDEKDAAVWNGIGSALRQAGKDREAALAVAPSQRSEARRAATGTNYGGFRPFKRNYYRKYVIRRFVNTLPVANGHTHFGSSVPFETIWRLALDRRDIVWEEQKALGRPLLGEVERIQQSMRKWKERRTFNPARLLDKARGYEKELEAHPDRENVRKALDRLKREFWRWLTIPKRSKLTLDDFTILYSVIGVLTKGDSSLVERLAYDIGIKNYRDGVRYLELRASLSARPSMDETKAAIREQLEAVRQGLERSEHSVNRGLAPDAIGLETRIVATFAKNYDVPILLMQAKALVAVLKENPELVPWVVAVDFANSERQKYPSELIKVVEVIHEYNRERARQKIPRLKITFHIGEDVGDPDDMRSFESILRQVHEAFRLLGADQVGHATILGIDLTQFQGRVVREHVSERIFQILYDQRRWLKDRAGMYAVGLGVDPQALAGEFETLVGTLQLPEPVKADIRVLSAELLRNYGLIKLNEFEQLAAILHRYRHDHPDHRIPITYDRGRISQLKAAQWYVLNKITKHRKVIEMNPTVNVRIGPMAHYGQHQAHRIEAFEYRGSMPRFRGLHPRFTINPDNPTILSVHPRYELWKIGYSMVLTNAEIARLAYRGFLYRLSPYPLKYRKQIQSFFKKQFAGRSEARLPSEIDDRADSGRTGSEPVRGIVPNQRMSGAVPRSPRNLIPRISGVEWPFAVEQLRSVPLEWLALVALGGIFEPQTFTGPSWEEAASAIFLDGKKPGEILKAMGAVQTPSLDGVVFRVFSKTHEPSLILQVDSRALDARDAGAIADRLALLPVGSAVIEYADLDRTGQEDILSALMKRFPNLHYVRKTYRGELPLEMLSRELARSAKAYGIDPEHAGFLTARFPGHGKDADPEKWKALGLVFQFDPSKLPAHARLLKGLSGAVLGELAGLAGLDRELREKALAEAQARGLIGSAGGAYTFHLDLWLDFRASQLMSAAA